MKIFPILDQSHGLTALGQNSNFATFPKCKEILKFFKF